MVDELKLSVPGVAVFELLANFLDAILDTDALVLNCSRYFGSCDLSVGRKCAYIGECASYVRSESIFAVLGGIGHVEQNQRRLSTKTGQNEAEGLCSVTLFLKIARG